MPRDPVRRAYSSQAACARQRGIPFEFGFEEWVNWWKAELGSNWFKFRGCKRGQYVMARKLDRGPYAVWNVECVTAGKNVQDALKQKSKSGVKNGNAALCVSDINLIRTSTKSAAKLAKLHNVSYHTIWRIRNNLTYK